MSAGESLDTKILKILSDYYAHHRGDPQMLIADLYDRLSGEEQSEIHAEILRLDAVLLNSPHSQHSHRSVFSSCQSCQSCRKEKPILVSLPPGAPEGTRD